MQTTTNPQPIQALSIADIDATNAKAMAAVDLCSGLLGDCYIMAEIIDWLLQPNGGNILNIIKSQKWCKQEVKYYIGQAVDKLRYSLIECRYAEGVNKDFNQSVADGMYDILKLDIFKLQNSIRLFLNKKQVLDTDAVACFFLIDNLFTWIGSTYTKTIQNVKDEVFDTPSTPDFYDSWLGYLKFEGPTTMWDHAVQHFCKKNLHKFINLNESPDIVNGLKIINRKIKSRDIAEELRKEAAEWAEEGKGKARFDKALETLNIKKIS